MVDFPGARIIQPLNPNEGTSSQGQGEQQPDYMRPYPSDVTSAIERGTGLGARDMIQGVFGGPYDLIAKGINATGVLPEIRPLSENLTRWGFPKPETSTERAISSVQEPVAGVAGTLATGGVLSRAPNVLMRTVGQTLQEAPASQAVAAGTGGAVTEATDNPWLGLAASVAMPFGGQLVRAGGRALEKAVIGGNISADDAVLGQLAKSKYGIDINAGDLTDNQMQRTVLDQAGRLPFSGARASVANKQGQWQGAILNEMGEPGAVKFTPNVMNRAATRIGKTFDDAATRTNIPPSETAQLTADLDTIAHDADRVLLAGELDPLIKQIGDLKDLIAKNNGHIDGATYQRLTRADSLLSKLERRNDNTGDFAGHVRDALDDAFARSASQADQEALRQARYQYRIMRTVDQLAAGSRTGDITPAGFMQKVSVASRTFDPPTKGLAYTGGGNIGELAHIGQLMRKAPDSGTADRWWANAVTGAGLTGAYNYVTPEGAAVTGAGLLANRLAGNYLRSGATADRLIENVQGGAPTAASRFGQASRTGQVAALNSLLRMQSD